MNVQQRDEKRIPFADADDIFAELAQDDIVHLAYSAGDFLLAIDASGRICDVSAGASDYPMIHGWIGQKWIDTVTIESRIKIEQLLKDQNPGGREWRQVNHPDDDNEFPVRYKLITFANGRWRIAVGKDLRPLSQLQQRLLKTQQSMERDYLNLRQAETRYRILFDNISYPVLIVQNDNRHIEQANQAAHALFGAAGGALENHDFLKFLEPGSRDKAIAYFGAASVSNAVDPVSVTLMGSKAPIFLTASYFRQAGKQYLLITLNESSSEAGKRTTDRYVLDVVERMPDAFVLTNADQEIVVANLAFAEMVQANTVEQLIGMPLSSFIGRPAIDLNLLTKQLKNHSNARNFSSIVNDLNGHEEPVEISAIMVERDQPLYGYSLRSIGRRERDLPPSPTDLPRSVDQLTELVGRKPLREIVRESTDLIERMCIEAALVHTADNRASAAEILGLSRQGLYAKLHRHGLGNLGGRDD